MGLILKEKTFTNGVHLQNVYCRIGGIGGCKNQMSYTIRYYANQDARLSNKDYIEEITKDFIPDVSDNAANIFKQCYDDLKSTDGEFLDAVDC